jgi:hypothetical protein
MFDFKLLRRTMLVKLEAFGRYLEDQSTTLYSLGSALGHHFSKKFNG